MTAGTEQSDGQLPTPNGCRWCGLPLAGHYRQWKPPVGWHGWTPPTDQQRKQRMRARREQTDRTVDDTFLLRCG